MNKELEDFKKELIIKLKAAIDVGRTVRYNRVKELINEIKPKPEFVEGEHVLMFNINRKHRQIRVFSSMNEDDNCFNFEDLDGTCWKYCEKIDTLPMHMTVHNRSTEYPDGVSKNALVYVKLTSGYYDGGRADAFDWSRIVRYQILKDLNL